ncbi:DNA ligase [Aeromonas phage AerS_266]|nr:DNA ligase [Aeromonas phage AerS_266]
MSKTYLDFVELEKQIKYHDYLYTVVDKPIISDAEYDRLVHEYHELLESNPLFKPQHTPGFVEAPEGFKLIKIKEPLISIVKKKTVEDFNAWIKKNIDTTATEEEKLDGLSVRLGYQYGILAHGHLRGSRSPYGIDVTHRLKLVKNIPTEIPELANVEYAHIDGEVFCTYADLEKYCEKWDKDYSETEPRTTVAGMIKRLKDHETDTLVMYFKAFNADKATREKCKEYPILRKKFEEWGFDIPQQLDGTLLRDLLKATSKPNFGYPIDGIVVKDNDLLNWNDTQMTGYYSYTACYKFPTISLVTKLRDVIWNLTTQGCLTGVLLYDPVEYDGTMLQRAKFDYPDEYIRAGIRIDSVIEVTKANEIIPKLVGIKELGKGKKITFPDKCPCCDSILIVETPSIRRCVNDSCIGKFLKQMSRLVDTQGLNIKGLGPKGLEALIDAGYLSAPHELFQISREDYLNLDVFDQNQVDNILEQLSQTSLLGLEHWLYASCIPNMGAVAALEFAQEQGKRYNDLSEMIVVLKSQTAMMELFGVDGIVMSKYVKDNESKLTSFFSHHNFYNPVKTIPDLIPIAITGSWVISREELKRKLAEEGFGLVDKVTKSITQLIVSKDPSPAKIAKAEQYGIRIIEINSNTSYQMLVKLLNK